MKRCIVILGMRTSLMGAVDHNTPLPSIPVGLWLSDPHQLLTAKRFIQADWPAMQELRANLTLQMFPCG